MKSYIIRISVVSIIFGFSLLVSCLKKNETASDMVAGCLFTMYRLRFHQHMEIPGLATIMLVDRGKVIPGYYVPLLRKSLLQHPHLVYFGRKWVKINLLVHIYQLLVIMSVMLSGIHARLILRDQNLPRWHFETIWASKYEISIVQPVKSSWFLMHILWHRGSFLPF